MPANDLKKSRFSRYTHGANLHAEQHDGHGADTYIRSKCDAGIAGGFAGDE